MENSTTAVLNENFINYMFDTSLIISVYLCSSVSKYLQITEIQIAHFLSHEYRYLLPWGKWRTHHQTLHLSKNNQHFQKRTTWEQKLNIPTQCMGLC